MALTPFAPTSSFGLDTGRLFDDFFGGALAPWAGGGGLLGRSGLGGALVTRPLYTDVVERDKEYEMRVDVPGVPKENISLEADGQNLRLSVQQVQSDEKSGDTWHRVERSSQFASRSLRFPDEADLSKVSANMDAGVLRVTIPKRELSAGQKRQQIKVA